MFDRQPSRSWADVRPFLMAVANFDFHPFIVMPGWLGVVTCRLVMVWMARAWGKDVRCHKRFWRTDWDVTWTLVMEPARRWKVVERLLSKAEKSSPEAAFKVLKETLVRMQAPVSWLWVLIYRASLVILLIISFVCANPWGTKGLQAHFSQAVQLLDINRSAYFVLEMSQCLRPGLDQGLLMICAVRTWFKSAQLQQGSFEITTIK